MKTRKQVEVGTQLAGMEEIQRLPWRSAGPSHVLLPGGMDLTGHEGEEVLQWEWGEGIAWPEHNVDLSSALARFIELPSKGPRGVLSFAKKFGPLYLCEHGLPACHHRDWIDILPFMGLAPSDWGWAKHRMRHLSDAHRPVRGECVETGAEPVEFWMRWANQFSVALIVASDLRRGRMASRDDWSPLFEARPEVDQVVLGYYEALRDPARTPDVPLGRRILSWYVQDILSYGAVRPHLRWGDSDAPKVTMEGLGIFGVLAIQLAAALTSGVQLSCCAGCGGVISDGRRRPEGSRHWCKECGKLAADRIAARDYRARKKREREQASASKSS